jgi:hypothetical protein
MITTINEWKKVNESLSKDRANKAKLDMLIQAAREMMEYKEKANQFAELKKSGNVELEQLLDDMEATSIVANGVLVEVIKPYETHRLDTKEYTKFVEDSIDTIGEGYKQMHDNALKLAETVKKGYAYTITAQNKKNLETGTLESLDMFKKFASWIKEQINKFKNFLNSFKSDLTDIKSQALQFQNINEGQYFSHLDPENNYYTIEHLKMNKVAVINDGNISDLQFLFKNIFDKNVIDDKNKIGYTNNDYKYYWIKNDIKSPRKFDKVFSKINASNTLPEIPTQSINIFLKQLNESLHGYDNVKATDVHISQIKCGDIVIHGGEMKTVGKNDIKYDSFMGTSLFGDSYKSGSKLVKKIDFVVPKNIDESIYPGRTSKYKNKIVEVLSTSNDLSYLELFDKTGFTTTSEDYGLYRNVQLLLNDNIITRFKDGRKYRYNLDPTVDITQIDMTDATTGPVDNAPVVEALEKAKQVIENAEQEKYYEELAKVKQKQVMDLLREFGAKKVAIDDKIISLIEVQESTRIDMEKYQDYMMNADEVSESIADMATSLFGLYTKVSKVSGSVRQFADDQGLEDGTLNATFDYVFKTVTKPEDNLNNPKAQVTEPVEEGIGSWIKKVWRGIKRFFSNFRISSKRVDIALKNIN